ncbi:hypothetical protein COO60DRAFT_643760 [Scenedesmus sp. NREL 46B-D3]|nr:hypothetical protein COO60DRAFT_643760 [Scenedesmus sp. NREL 46B-D3]
MEPYTVKDTGEKVLQGSRRPDGTVRKERRIRAGYTPQDEQPTYQSTGVMARVQWQLCGAIDVLRCLLSSNGLSLALQACDVLCRCFCCFAAGAAAGAARRAKVPRA